MSKKSVKIRHLRVICGDPVVRVMKMCAINACVHRPLTKM